MPGDQENRTRAGPFYPRFSYKPGIYPWFNVLILYTYCGVYLNVDIYIKYLHYNSLNRVGIYTVNV